MIGINSRVYDGADVSWFRKYDFSACTGRMKKVFATGDARDVILASLADSGIAAEGLETENDIFSVIKNSRLPVVCLLNYTCMMSVRSLFAKAGYVEDFWKN